MGTLLSLQPVRVYCSAFAHCTHPTLSLHLTLLPLITALASGSRHTCAVSMCLVPVHSREYQLNLPESVQNQKVVTGEGLEYGCYGKNFLTEPEDSGASEENERGRNLREVTCAVMCAATDSQQPCLPSRECLWSAF